MFTKCLHNSSQSTFVPRDTVISKGKYKRHEGIWDRRGMATLIPNLGARWKRVVIITPRLLYHRLSLRYPMYRRQGGPLSLSRYPLYRRQGGAQRLSRYPMYRRPGGPHSLSRYPMYRRQGGPHSLSRYPMYRRPGGPHSLSRYPMYRRLGGHQGRS
jgi:hypothetical protein